MDGKQRAPMGSHKHGVSGHAGKSPKLRAALKRMAEADTKGPKAKPIKHPSATVVEAIRDYRPPGKSRR